MKLRNCAKQTLKNGNHHHPQRHPTLHSDPPFPLSFPFQSSRGQSRTSMRSMNSRSSSRLSESDQLKNELHQLFLENDRLVKENLLLQQYLSGLSENELAAAEEEEKANRMRKHKGKGGPKKLEKLSTQQKIDIANTEYEKLVESKDQTVKKRQEDAELVKAAIEEAKMREKTYQRDEDDFAKEVVENAYNHRTGKFNAEKIIRFFEDKEKSKTNLREQLKLKCLNLKRQIQDAELSLIQKEEMSESLKDVDFEQLKIEHNQYIEKHNKKDKEVSHLKKRAGKTVHMLNNYKKKLNRLSNEEKKLQKDIEARKETLEKLKGDITKVGAQKAKSEAINRHLRQQQEEYKVPEVLEYVAQRAEQYELEKKVKNWERKVEIAEKALKLYYRRNYDDEDDGHSVVSDWYSNTTGMYGNYGSSSSSSSSSGSVKGGFKSQVPNLPQLG
eukprot:TRINITY_DN1438_c0_g6_i1.p1 TRINITY_DN1438_c0_g6~~TRINITY_DN1438_c0_g6_i1.p1  ORF type:complete len:443 (-),score=171.56 TRINITY_DN1438_c0_g6_i1:221-1549(-)